ncbi:hypothetical protein DPMN_064315 [Dreissena polymorpha]|uniref:Uncharacterized protein n=1 Tax=Dreissena polymorpha TaxID=45954 RepID=A0A9D4CC22_DREPO|nr:hypothetical protein DPMN_064315 [Dreissena polymorpha]
MTCPELIKSKSRNGSLMSITGTGSSTPTEVSTATFSTVSSACILSVHASLSNAGKDHLLTSAKDEPAKTGNMPHCIHALEVQRQFCQAVADSVCNKVVGKGEDNILLHSSIANDS